MNSLKANEIIMTIKNSLEKGIGLKNLTSFEYFQGTAFLFGIKKMKFVLDISDLSVYRFVPGRRAETFFDDTCSILQSSIRKSVNQYMESEKR